ncbi:MULTISPECIES: hypothetical protein [unclassified Rickettsia]
MNIIANFFLSFGHPPIIRALLPGSKKCRMSFLAKDGNLENAFKSS